MKILIQLFFCLSAFLIGWEMKPDVVTTIVEEKEIHIPSRCPSTLSKPVVQRISPTPEEEELPEIDVANGEEFTRRFSELSQSGNFEARKNLLIDGIVTGLVPEVTIKSLLRQEIIHYLTTSEMIDPYYLQDVLGSIQSSGMKVSLLKELGPYGSLPETKVEKWQEIVTLLQV